MKKKSTNRTRAAASTWNWNYVLLTAVLAAAFLLLLLTYLLPPPEVELSDADVRYAMDEASFAFEQQQWPMAEQFAASVPKKSPLFPKSRLIAGEAATRMGNLQSAVEYYAEISDGTSEDALTAAFATGEIYRASAQIEKAVEAYEHVLENSDNPLVLENLAFLSGITGQHWKAGDYLFQLVKQDRATIEHLSIYADLERSVEQPDYVRLCAELTPNEPFSQLAIAAEKIFDGKTDQARPLLEQVIATRPELLAAQAMLGKILLVEDPTALLKWHAGLPVEAERYPDIWFIRGLKARSDRNLELATGCFAEAVQLQPEYRLACYQLGQSLAQLNSPLAQKYVERAKLQAELGRMVDQVLQSKGSSVRALQSVTEISEQFGRIWEARGWALATLEMHPSATWAEPIVQRCAAKLQADLPRSTTAAGLVAQSELGKYLELARSQKLSPQAEASAESRPVTQPLAAQVRFKREDTIGIDFAYNNGPDPATAGVRMFEQTGGGVGVIDYDNDGRPDVYFTQGANWKTGENTPSPSDSVRDFFYRNLNGKQFIESATAARIINLDFTQGIAVADYDADGFDDIFLGQIGFNQLWRNNGDGTFSDHSSALGTQLPQWTTSCVMVDLNNDGLLDIYEVNYLQGPDVYQLICGDIGCSPSVFDGAPDQLRINRGDGTFELIPDASPQQLAKGLGVLAVAIGEDRTPSLFVANDQVPNFLLIPEILPSGEVKLNDEALLRGVAFNVDGLAMAGMGIAADDIDQNGLIDLFVTNFSDEANTLYMQDVPGLFVDRTQNTGMLTSSLPYVGWGTQFIDADLDSLSDVVVINGNVADYRPRGGDYAMLPQFFRNRGNAQFKLSEGAEAGEFFAQKRMGRALAKLDWNGDGRMDLVVSMIGEPAALLTNETEPAGRFLNVRLIGTRSARTPVGAIVRATTERGTWTKQLTAGDGYQASNQRILQFGLGAAREITQLDVIWPSGTETTINGLPTNSTLEVVEGLQQLNLTIAPQ